MKQKITYTRLNYSLFAIGMIGVWITTESGWALFWTLVASVHLTSTREIKWREVKDDE